MRMAAKVMAIGVLAAGCSKTGTGADPGWVGLGQPPAGVKSDGAIVLDGDRIVVGTDQGVLISGDGGGSWTKGGMGLPASSVEALFVGRQRMLAGVAQGGVFASTDHGATWISSDPNLPLDVSPAVFFDTGDVILVGMKTGSLSRSVEGGIFRSVDGGVTWAKSSTGLANSAGALSFAREGQAILSCAGGRIARSTDDGKTWLPTSLPSGEALSVVSGGIAVFASSSDGKVYTEEGGGNWTELAPGLPAEPGHLLVSVDDAVYATAFASGQSGIYVSRATDTWASFNEGLDTTSIVGMVVRGTTLYSVDSKGRVWQREQLPLPGV